MSGKTTILLVGKNPGFSKVSKARARPKCTLMSLHELRETLIGNAALEDLAAAPAMIISSFSAGSCIFIVNS